MELLGIGSRVSHADWGDGVVINLKSSGYSVAFIREGIQFVRFAVPLAVIEAVEPADDMVSWFDVEQSLTRVLQKWADITETVPLGDRWKNGKMVLKPGRNDLASKEMPIDVLFHKIVMIRDRLRTLEQRINASQLDDAEKLTIQQYITRIYGSLTSFNVLFKHADQVFVGERSGAEA
jgi:hypothetical protein